MSITKDELEALVLKFARWGRDVMVEQHGDFCQQAALLDGNGKVTMAAFPDAVLHGSQMAAALFRLAAGVRNVDAIIVISDARVTNKPLSPEEVRHVQDQARDGNYVIADDPGCQEVLIVAGRAREHQVFLQMAYRRQGEKIEFHDPEPRIDEHIGRVTISLIPNVWPRVN